MGQPRSGDTELGMQRYRVTATVLESPQHGPQLCAGMAQSFPPQGRGPDIIGWDWDKVEAESVHGTTWGRYQLVGTFDHVYFTLTEPATPAIRATRPDELERTTTPCPEPEGGWRPLDKSKATEEAARRAGARRGRSRSLPAYGLISHI